MSAQSHVCARSQLHDSQQSKADETGYVHTTGYDSASDRNDARTQVNLENVTLSEGGRTRGDTEGVIPLT